ncbi:MlaC/ttg2D family ABC transporter substrate-binding protein [Nitrosococcus oceani]|uniref:Toluene tolerance protein n=3 Tax=Nitrosococcus oceani TaxID=1229 RepID=Q3J9E0_NITOC|nr:ABC transporter substrate-binding protein [Nitrosococcus oceani]ABA58556.1 Toluene tolerance protein [Nitrosococcus oceani ATCC 19707]KFI19009.1 toluene tolerance protein [Nitrosococcus oceani C-27]KFI22266.1 toluene tolerance protein [Nitrosococcus oceani]
MNCRYRVKQSLMGWIMVTGLILPLGVGAQAATSSPRDIVLETSQRVLKELQDQQVTPADNPEYFYRLADEFIVPHFNFRRMSQRVLGKHWRQATQEQKADFTNQFRQLLVRTYVTALHSYSAKDIRDFLQERIKVLPVNYPPEATRVGVKVQVEGDKGRPPINMMLNLYLDQNKAWKVDDVQVEGVSLVTNYRASFYREIRANGLQGLIDRLTARNQQAMK